MLPNNNKLSISIIDDHTNFRLYLNIYTKLNMAKGIFRNLSLNAFNLHFYIVRKGKAFVPTPGGRVLPFIPASAMSPVATTIFLKRNF